MFKKLLSILTVIVMMCTFSTTAFASGFDVTENIKTDYITTSSGNLVSRDEINKFINFKTTTNVDRDLIKKYLDEVDNLKAKTVQPSNVLLASTSYGGAWAYTSETSQNINCYGYASRFNGFLNPGDVYAVYGLLTAGDSASKVASYVLQDLGRAYRQSRIISSSTDAINSDEYRIALRVGNQQDIYDYHFMLQTSSGSWCDKPGSTPSRNLGYINPSTYSWDLGTAITNFYNSSTIYIAVKL